MATKILEGTWEEITRHAKSLAGRKVRVLVLEDEVLPKPNEKALEIIERTEAKQKKMRFTTGEKGIDIVRRGRAGQMFKSDTGE